MKLHPTTSPRSKTLIAISSENYRNIASMSPILMVMYMYGIEQVNPQSPSFAGCYVESPQALWTELLYSIAVCQVYLFDFS